MWIFLALIIVPLIEIGLFIEIGGLIGLWPTIGVVILTAVIGAALLRAQGLAALGELQERLKTGQDPARTLAHGALILVAGVTLLTPGFFTDALGFLLLVPAVRSAVIAWLGRHVKVVHASAHGAGTRPPPGRGPTIDGEYEDVTPNEAPAMPGQKPSGWTGPDGRED